MIRVENLQKFFGPVRAVDGVSFSVSKGEVVGLLGPNGAGKTTTMRVITGYLTADAGSVAVDGVPVSRDELRTRRVIGYLPESAPLYTDLEVAEFLSYIASLRGIAPGERSARIREMIETCGLEKVVGRPIGELSKGFRQRVGLAAAMIHHPPILILDEPTSGLDPNQIAEIRSLIREIGKSRTVILSTHILQEVEATCSRAVIISGGKLVGQGTIADLAHKAGSKSTYTVRVRATQEAVKAALEKLPDLAFGAWITKPGDDRQRFTLLAGDARDHSEDLFHWAVENKFTLSELAHETASLEEVFRELTQN